MHDKFSQDTEAHQLRANFLYLFVTTRYDQMARVIYCFIDYGLWSSVFRLSGCLVFVWKVFFLLWASDFFLQSLFSNYHLKVSANTIFITKEKNTYNPTIFLASVSSDYIR